MKDETASWWSSLANSASHILFYLLVFFLPTQFGKHFWPSWSYVYGQRIDYLSPTLFLTDVLVILLFLFVLVKKQFHTSFLFALVVLYLSFTVFFSKYSFEGWYALFKFLEMSFVAYFVATHIHLLNKKIMGVALATGIIFESLLALAQFYIHSSLGGILYFLGERTFSSETPGIANATIHGALVLRPYATFSHPNVLAGFLLIGMLIVWYLLKTEKNKVKPYILWILTVIGSGGLLLTLSRTTILLGIGIGLFLILRKLQKRFIAAFISLLFLLFILFPTLLYRFAPSTFEESAAAREQLMQASFTMILSHPLLGVGLGNFLSSLPSSSLLQPVHNVFLLWVSETGILGGAIALVVLAIFSKNMWKHWHQIENDEKEALFPLLLVCVSIGVLGMFDHYFLTLQQGQLLLALLTGLIVAHLNK